MGLDLWFVSKVELLASELEKRSFEELVYGRKTWALAHYFEVPENQIEETEYEYDIDKSKFEQFESEVQPYYVELKELVEYADKYEETLNQSVYDLIEDRVENILDNILCDNYTLGAIWEARVVLKMYESLKDIYKVYELGDSVVMIEDY